MDARGDPNVGVDDIGGIMAVFPEPDKPQAAPSPQPPRGRSRQPLYGGSADRRITVRDLARAKLEGERWPMLTAYDAMVAQLVDESGVPVLLVGDSAAMVVLGHPTTLPITVDDLILLTGAVVRGTKRAMIVADLPFGSYQESCELALRTATRFLKETGAQAVKLEGGHRVVPQIRTLVEAGIPVMAHVGLTPQSVNTIGGYRVQGRGEAADQLLVDAEAVADAGAFSVVLELVPHDLAERVTKELRIPTIGIGAGSGTDAQVLVWQDLLGLTPGRPPKFVRKYADLRAVMRNAVRDWAADVVAGRYPDLDHSYE